MKKIALIASPFLPVPNVAGGAVEYLCTEILNGNENSVEDYHIDVFTKKHAALDKYKYKKTSIIQVKIAKYITAFCRGYNLINKLLRKPARKEPYNIALVKKYLKNDYDYILIENGMYVYKDIYESGKYNDKLYFHIHNDYDGINFTHELAKLIGETAQKVIAVSEYIKKSYSQDIPKEKIDVCYNCINRDLFDFKKKDDKKVEELREKYKILQENTIIMYSGRINKNKGVLELVKAFKNIKQLNAKLLIVGSCWFDIVSSNAYLEQIKAEAKDIEEKIVFTGFVNHDDMPYIYSLADVLVVPSMWEEPFGLIITEGMAMKLPIIATRSGAIPELLSGENDILINKDERLIENLSSAIDTLCNDPEICIKIADEAYSRLLNELKIDHSLYFDKLIKCIEN